jgi:RNA polymerase nonessential primary-like sigma factor
VRLPVHIVREVQHVLRARRDLEADSQWSALHPGGANASDIAGLMQCDVAQVERLLVWAEPVGSLDAARGSDEDSGTLADHLEADEHDTPTHITQTHEVQQLLDNWISTLNAREKEVLHGRFGLHQHDEETLDTLSVRLGLTRERVRQIQNEALTKIKHHIQKSGSQRDGLL